MDLVEIAWVAGILEGEGCFTPSPSKGRAYPCIQVISTDRDVLELLAGVIGAGKINGPQRTRSENHTPTHHYRVGSVEAVEVMTAVFPFMCQRRRTQIIDGLREVISTAPEVEQVRGYRIRRRVHDFLGMIPAS